MFDLSSFLSNLPHLPGVYRMLDSHEKIIYIGKASNLKKRVSSYFLKKITDLKTKAMVKQITSIEITVTNSEIEAFLLEAHLIKKHLPHYNVLLRDDRSFPYILLTQTDEFPRVDFFRGNREKSQMYFGPYLSSQSVRESIQWIQKIFQIRTCTNRQFAPRSRPCMLYQLKRCSAPCVGYVTKTDYQEQVKQATWFLSGKDGKIKIELEKKMQDCIDRLEFERAAIYRDQLKRIRELQEKQYIVHGKDCVDVFALIVFRGMIAVHLMTVRSGQVSGNQTWFPSVPIQTDSNEILSSVMSQYYFSHLQNQSFPNGILLSESCSEKENLEKALSLQAGFKLFISMPSRGHRKKWVELAYKNGKQALMMRGAQQSQSLLRLQALQSLLKSEDSFERMACLDISHHLGESTVASIVVFENGVPSKKNYRHFSVEINKPGDDLASIEFAIEKYLQSCLSRKQLPQLFIIDGGQLQLARAQSVCLRLNLPLHQMRLMSVAKGEGRKPGLETLFVPLLDEVDELAIVNLSPDDPALHLVQAIRDEAHRFGIRHHRKKQRKVRKKTQLDGIEGIGSARRNSLIRYFGSIKAISHASLDEIVNVKGISRTVAQRIYSALHGDSSFHNVLDGDKFGMPDAIRNKKQLDDPLEHSATLDTKMNLHDETEGDIS